MISKLNDLVLDQLANLTSGSPLVDCDIDFCHKDFERYYGSEEIEFRLDGFTDSEGRPIQIKQAGVYQAADLAFLPELLKQCHADSDASISALDIVKDIRIETKTESEISTNGNILDYVQAELSFQKKIYFLLDKKWYELAGTFDKALEKQFVERYRKKFPEHKFILPWKSGDETAYNKQYDAKANSIYVHPLTIDNVELFDVLVFDKANKVLYLLYVKDGLNATTRELTSQAFMGAKIIESEVRANSQPKLKRLYSKCVKRKRINSSNLKESEFIQMFKEYEREYCLVIRPPQSTTLDMIKAGKFRSRIAKFSLVELSSIMNASAWGFSVGIV